MGPLLALRVLALLLLTLVLLASVVLEQSLAVGLRHPLFTCMKESFSCREDSFALQGRVWPPTTQHPRTPPSLCAAAGGGLA